MESLFYIDNRLGLDGMEFPVFKIRTMVDGIGSFDEIVSLNGVSSLGKPKNDLRIIPWRRFLRVYHLDEIPQIVNIFRSDMKLVGIRPRNSQQWKSFPESHRKRALQYKPGLFGVPYAVPVLSDFEHLLQVEEEYLDRYEESSYRTDLEYFLRISYNLLRGQRSE
ncbi:hypothetical protein GF386_02670 [Candidatus Pacearchaeota archaeon]|nr:hypothetical protein [Candidatus Pacearchaeota archaeon]MBD3283052.1 hypothetical protein [Candidatus Pacearchaeota archaeon]